MNPPRVRAPLQIDTGKLVSAVEAVALIRDGDTIATKASTPAAVIRPKRREVPFATRMSILPGSMTRAPCLRLERGKGEIPAS